MKLLFKVVKLSILFTHRSEKKLFCSPLDATFEYKISKFYRENRKKNWVGQVGGGYKIFKTILLLFFAMSDIDWVINRC